jgi:O-acetyl-ADP-ribose deacetylase (regulator of RNase III)
MKTTQGDLLKLALGGEFDVIIHGCNCQCTMGAGIARLIKSTFPEAYEADCRTQKGDKRKLGAFSFATVERDGRFLSIVNAYTQFHWRGLGVLVDYGAIRSCMHIVKSEFHGKRIGYPKIGAGLAKGDWNVISHIIDEELDGEDHTLVEYAAGNKSGGKNGP